MALHIGLVMSNSEIYLWPISVLSYEGFVIRFSPRLRSRSFGAHMSLCWCTRAQGLPPARSTIRHDYQARSGSYILARNEYKCACIQAISKVNLENSQSRCNLFRLFTVTSAVYYSSCRINSAYSSDPADMAPKKARATNASSKKVAKDHSNGKAENLTTESKPLKKPEDKVLAREDSAKGHLSKTNMDGSKEAKSNTSKKRKSPTGPSEPDDKPAAKIPRQGTRNSSRTKPSTSTAASARQILNFLLSPAALPYCYPDDDLKATQKKKYSTTSPAVFTPFEHLLTASLLSKPLSHRLGMRTTRTFLNAPFNFNSPEKIVDAGEKRVWEALEEARTQHRQKTASYVYDMAQAFEDGEAMNFLKEMVNERGPDGVITEIGKTIKGMGKTGAEIFCRRIQAVEGWGDAVWPFADGRSLEAVRNLGVEVKDADDLQEKVETLVDWDKVGKMGLDQGERMDMEHQVQVEYVVLLERAVGASLEGKIEEVKQAAARNEDQ